MPKVVGRLAGLLLSLCGLCGLGAETLEDALRAAGVPTGRFAALELSQKIASYAISKDEPFLLAYYTDNGSGRLKLPLHVIRYSRATGDLRQADLQNVGGMDWPGDALRIREHSDAIYIETHLTPSAGLVIVLSSDLSFEAALSGWVVGLLGADYAIVQRSETHFASVHPLHIDVFDLKRNRLTQVYPFADDPVRRQFARLLRPHIVTQWCMTHNAQCDPRNFDAGLDGQAAVDEKSVVFGFAASFDAEGFGEAAQNQVGPQSAVYIFRLRGGTWEHRVFRPGQLQPLFGVTSIAELVSEKPDAAFGPANRGRPN
jgi:hypothetical protein